jgi:hypothetical protein
MKTKIAAIVLGLTIAATGMGMSSVSAAPITCPGAQVAEKVDSWWSCVNPADHENESGADRNPNGNPNS